MDSWKDEEIERLKAEIRLQEDAMREVRREMQRLRCVIRQLQEEEMEILAALSQEKLSENTENGKIYNTAIDVMERKIREITQIKGE